VRLEVYRRTYRNGRLPVRELPERRRALFRAQSLADSFHERGVRRAAEHYSSTHSRRAENEVIVKVGGVRGSRELTKIVFHAGGRFMAGPLGGQATPALNARCAGGGPAKGVIDKG
jgi:hypothetical protein